jgi:hypothetical protein
VQCVSEFLNKDKHLYSVCVQESEQGESGHDEPEVDIVLVKDERNNCFHIALARKNTNIENAKAICFQAVLYYTNEEDPSLYFAVYDTCTQMVHFCLCDPFQQTFEDTSCYSIQTAAEVIAKWLRVYTDSNAAVLCQ